MSEERKGKAVSRAYTIRTDVMARERGRRGWSQKRAAEKAGINPSLWNRIEKGRVPSPQYETLERMAELYGLEVEDLVEPTLASPVAA